MKQLNDSGFCFNVNLAAEAGIRQLILELIEKGSEDESPRIDGIYERFPSHQATKQCIGTNIRDGLAVAAEPVC